MNGTDSSYNLVLLTAREHVIAHVLLSKIFPDNLKIIQSTSAILMKGSKRLRNVNLSFIIKIRENYSKHAKELAKRQVGKHVSTSIRNKISKANKGKTPTQETKQKLIQTRQRYEIENTKTGEIYESLKEASTKLGISRHKIRKLLSDSLSDLKLISKVRKSFCYRVKGPDGTIYKSIKDCAKTLNKCDKTIKKWITKYPEFGYEIIDD